MTDELKTTVLKIAQLRIGESLASAETEVLMSASLRIGENIASAATAAAIDDVRSAVGGALTSRDLVLGTKAIVIAVLRGTSETGEAALKVLAQTTRTVVRQTADLSGDVGESTLGLVLGAIASAKAMGVEGSKAASTAAQAAIDEAKLISRAAAMRVRGVLKASSSRRPASVTA